jgi:hypothetical protein
MIDLDTFDPDTYFPARTDGHCVAIALALHRITGWPLFSLAPDDEWVIPYIDGAAWQMSLDGIDGFDWHAVVLSPLGFLDLYGPHAEKWFARALGREPEEIHTSATTTDALEHNYLHQRDDFDNALGSRDARVNLELAVPVAEAILARYFPDGWKERQLPLF